MRVNKDILEKWRAAIAPLDTPERRAKYISLDIPRADTVKDINIRYRFDLLWATIDMGKITHHEVETYADMHLSTALGRIVPVLGVAA
jgi:hypothetical protein